MILFRNGRPGVGIGDELFATGVAHALAQAGRPPWVSSAHPAIWQHNPDIRGYLPHLATKVLLRLFPRHVRNMRYENGDRLDMMHCIGRMAQAAGLPPEAATRPYLFLSPEEIAWGESVAKGAVLIQADAYTAWTSNKNWYLDRFEVVAAACRQYGPVLQIGNPTPTPPLRDAIDYRGKTALRQVAALLKAARLFIGTEGGLMHVCRAVDTPGVILFGGYVFPQQTGYPTLTNIATNLPCAPCWKREPCPNNMECMRQISVEQVLQAVAETLTSPVSDNVNG